MIDELKALQENQKQSREVGEQQISLMRRKLEEESAGLAACNAEVEHIEKQLQERTLLLTNKQNSLAELEKQVDQESKRLERAREEWRKSSLQIEEYGREIQELDSKREQEARTQTDFERKAAEAEKQLAATKESLSALSLLTNQLESKSQATLQRFRELEKQIAACKEVRASQESVLSNRTLQRLVEAEQNQRASKYP